MASNSAGASGSGLFGTLASWGSSVYSYAQEQITTVLGWEDLDVVDPDGEAAAKVGAPGSEGIKAEERRSWGGSQLNKYIGMDVTSLLSVPVWIMEPFTMLQKMAEVLEYTELLDEADACDDPHDRAALVAAFLVTPFGVAERAWKPFNPVLGETFEATAGNGVRYLAEQVSHHPPVGAAHAENAHFSYSLVSAPTTRFLGNSLEIFPNGRTRVTLKHCGETFTHTPPQAKAHNIIIGRTWVDAFGTFTVTNVSSGVKVVLEFTPCGWFSAGRYTFAGHVFDRTGCKVLLLSGCWNSHVDCTPCGPDGEPTNPGAQPRRLWTCNAKPEGDYYGFTHFAHRLNSCEGIPEPLPSDSRRRPDRAALEAGDTLVAGGEKSRVEEKQRAESRHREARGDRFTPRWFRHVEAPVLLPGDIGTDKVPFWESNGEYWQRLPAPEAEPAAVFGAGFNPWQYPEMHA